MHPSFSDFAPPIDSGRATYSRGQMPIFYIALVVIGAYLVDRVAFDGRYYSELRIAANTLAAQADYKVKDLLRPIR
jgi:hypothetical protein